MHFDHSFFPFNISFHSFNQSFIHSFTHSFTYSLTHSFIHSFIYSFIHSLIHPSLIHPFIYSFIHSFTHSFVQFLHSFSFRFHFHFAFIFISFHSVPFHFLFSSIYSCFCSFILSSSHPVIHFIHCIHFLQFIQFNSRLSSSPTVPISKLVPIAVFYFWNFRKVRPGHYLVYVYIYILYTNDDLEYPAVNVYIDAEKTIASVEK